MELGLVTIHWHGPLPLTKSPALVDGCDLFNTDGSVSSPFSEVESAVEHAGLASPVMSSCIHTCHSSRLFLDRTGPESCEILLVRDERLLTRLCVSLVDTRSVTSCFWHLVSPSSSSSCPELWPLSLPAAPGPVPSPSESLTDAIETSGCPTSPTWTDVDPRAMRECVAARRPLRLEELTFLLSSDLLEWKALCRGMLSPATPALPSG
mmetsp:Transcript_50609/g.118211  ORF Transcript_50609/g.118211 Transcript_50609/m.118211 type:complete len:208 (-) Transcript_50609:213-836(-)